MLPHQVLEKYIKAGKIASKVREEIGRTIKKNTPIIQICEKVENMIRDMGGEPAFPCNVSINEIAAHYTSPPDDKKLITENAIVKIDLGVHIDGYIVDTAKTVCFDPKHEKMINVAEEALAKAINILRPGLKISQLGSEIQRVIENHGFKPISNLSGHQIKRYMIHSGRSLPNINHFSLNKIEAGRIYAIEPFVTIKHAKGRVENSPERHIFRLLKHKKQKKIEVERLLSFIEKKFKTLPFAERWVEKHYPVWKIDRSPIPDLISYLEKDGAIVLT
jgi:methionyl aminopeptidase